MLDKKTIRKILKKISYFMLGLIAFFLITSLGLAIYIKQNKKVILSEINQQINQNINGKLTIEDVKFKFITGFPYATLALKKVTLKDSLWSMHHQTFVQAKEIEIRLNALKLIRNKIDIRKIVVNDASIILYKDANGYSNTYLLKPKKDKSKPELLADVKEIILNNVRFVAKNEKDKKLFDFAIDVLKTKFQYSKNHIKTVLKLNTQVKNMIFKSKNGSFLKDQWVKGSLEVDFNTQQNAMEITTKKLKIGKGIFELNGLVNLGKYNSDFILNLKTTILWTQMTPLVSPNISKILKKFDLKNPASATCSITGKWNIPGNPHIILKAKIIENELITPNSTINSCSFDGEYNNYREKGKGNNDPNSIIILNHFKGIYKTIPFELPVAKIIDLKKPVASGKLKSRFEIQKLNNILSDKLLLFSSGKAEVNFDFNINIINLKANKPKFTGTVLVLNTVLEYVPKKLVFNNTNIELDFTDQSLLIKKIVFKDKTNTVYMDGKIDRFLSLYYDDPDKMVVNWNIYSPDLDVHRFIGLLSKKLKNKPLKKNNADSFSEKLTNIFQKCQAIIHLKADKITYDENIAEHLNATIEMDNKSLNIKNGSLKTLGGAIHFNGNLQPKNNFIAFNASTELQSLDIEKILSALNNFGLKTLKSQKIKGQISANAMLSGLLQPNGKIIQNSVSIELKKGIINSLGGVINLEGALNPKDKLFNFNFNAQINKLSTSEVLAAFSNFQMQNLNTTHLNGPISANVVIQGQLLPNWRLYSNSLQLDVKNGFLKNLNGLINFDCQLKPKNKSYEFNANAVFNQVDLDQLLSTFNYFDIPSLEKQKIKGEFSSNLSLNALFLSSGNLLDNSIEIELKRGAIKCLDGTIAFNGNLFPKNKVYNFKANAAINKVNITQFLDAFDNFGINSFKPKNISGQLNATANIEGILKPSKGFVSNSITGDLQIDISKGSLVDFEPIKKVWGIIFPFRDFKNITFSSITGDLKVNGDKVGVNNFKVDSNVLNIDMEGIYSFNKGTNLFMTIPLRNPKKDIKIEDEVKKTEKRDNGIVLHLLAFDGPDGKIKIKLVGKKKKDKLN